MRQAFFCLLCVVLPLVFACLCGSGCAPAQKTTPAVRAKIQQAWFCQIGQWHLLAQPDSSHFLFHDAHSDGLRSGMTISVLKYNRTFDTIKSMSARLYLDKRPFCGGFMFKSPAQRYHLLVQAGADAAALMLLCPVAETWDTLWRREISALGDSVMLQLHYQNDSLQCLVDTQRVQEPAPAAFDSCKSVGLLCLEGAVRINAVSMRSADTLISDALYNTPVVNMHLERMFGASTAP